MGLDGFEVRVRFPAVARDFLFSAAFRPALWSIQFISNA
jgi:hypothetical protein